jgi:Resolvase, N terminal domain
MTAEDGLSTKGSAGKLVLNILGSIALFERNLMLERTRAGLAAAKAKGRIGGRRRKMGPAEVTRARQMLSKGELNADDVASMLRVSRRTLFRELRAARDREAISARSVPPATRSQSPESAERYWADPTSCAMPAAARALALEPDLEKLVVGAGVRVVACAANRRRAGRR